MTIRTLYLSNLLLLLVSPLFAVESPELSLGNDAAYDGAVRVWRSAEGEMLFQDLHTSPTALLQLAEPASAHGALTGLDADDHPHYLNAARHTAAHDQAFNNALPAGPDVAGNATLGDHLADGRLHLRRDTAEIVTGAWTLAAPLDLYSGARLSASGSAGSAWLEFVVAPSTLARFGWDATDARFEFERGLRVAAPAAAPAAGVALSEHAATLAQTAGDFTGTATAALRGRLDLTQSGTAGLAPGAWASAVDGLATFATTGTGIEDGRIAGVVGRAESATDVETIGVMALLAPSTAGDRAAALLAGPRPGELATYTMPSGIWAAVFKGETITDSRARAAEFGLQAGGALIATWSAGMGSPEGAVAARVGSLYSRLDGAAGTSLYIKESGTGNTGWVAK